jgi:hypothetical protein
LSFPSPIYICGAGYLGLLFLVVASISLSDISGFIYSLGSGFGSGSGSSICLVFSTCWLSLLRHWAVDGFGSSSELLFNLK